MAISTLCELFLEAERYDKPDCLLHKVDGRYVPISTAEMVDRVRRLSTVLKELGVVRGDRICIMAENGPHWPIVDFATLCSGAVLAPIYPTVTSEQAAYIANDAGAKVVFVDGAERLEGLQGVAGEMPSVEHLVFIGGGAPEGIATLDDLLAKAEPMARAAFEASARLPGADDLATLIYTSGTTGKPKGVMLSHGNIASNVEAALSRVDIPSSWIAISFLPLSHSFERTLDYCYFYKGCSVAYAESVAALAQNLGEVKPHVFVSVPRVYEKILAKVQDKFAQESPLKKMIIDFALATGRESLPWRLKLETPPGLLGLKLAIADKLVFTKIRERLGGRFVFACSGGAPLPRDVAEFFWGAGVAIYEGYGLTETAPVLTVNYPKNARLGSVGKAVPGVELRIAEDGEVLAKGPNIMQGYFNLPEATAETIDEDGWFHTGDIGEIDEDGFLAITDRKKELIVNAYGKNVAPAPIESSLKSSRFIEQAVVIGDRKKFLSALLVPSFEALDTWASQQGIAARGAELIGEPRVEELFREEVGKVNERLAKYEKIVAWRILNEEFTIESGEITPTLKIKRRVVHERHQEAIDSMYPAD